MTKLYYAAEITCMSGRHICRSLIHFLNTSCYWRGMLSFNPEGVGGVFETLVKIWLVSRSGDYRRIDFHAISIKSTHKTVQLASFRCASNMLIPNVYITPAVSLEVGLGTFLPLNVNYFCFDVTFVCERSWQYERVYKHSLAKSVHILLSYLCIFLGHY